MARALECPACGARHRLDTLPNTPTFRCDRCGQVLKVPDAIVSARAAAPEQPAGPSSASAPPRRAAPPGNGGSRTTAPPPPRRRGGAAPTGPTVSATSTGTGAVAAAATTGAAAGATNGAAAAGAGAPPEGRTRREKPAKPPREKVRLYWRVVAWVVAVPLGFVITAWPAFEFGFIEKDDVLDVFVGEGIGRYVRLLVGAAIWALVTALLVQLFVEGGRAFAARRRNAGPRDDGPPSASPPPQDRPRRPAPARS